MTTVTRRLISTNNVFELIANSADNYSNIIIMDNIDILSSMHAQSISFLYDISKHVHPDLVLAFNQIYLITNLCWNIITKDSILYGMYLCNNINVYGVESVLFDFPDYVDIQKFKLDIYQIVSKFVIDYGYSRHINMHNFYKLH